MAASPRDNEKTTLDGVGHAGHADQVGYVGHNGYIGGHPDLGGLAGGLPPGVSLPAGAPDGATAADDAADAEDVEAVPGVEEPEVEAQELRPQPKLRVWQLAPIVAFGALGSLMFAFPLAFEPGGSGAVVSMLGLLICGCAAGWSVMAARRVGLRWPGMPLRGSQARPDWRVVVLYAVVVGTAVTLAIWRVARLR
jgi:hypothetical protein